jgi:hypothetical protein
MFNTSYGVAGRHILYHYVRSLTIVVQYSSLNLTTEHILPPFPRAQSNPQDQILGLIPTLMATDPSAHTVMAVLDTAGPPTAIHALLFKAMSRRPSYLASIGFNMMPEKMWLELL